jgi:hypothetical protein
MLVLIAFQYATCVPVESVHVLSHCDVSAVAICLETVLVRDTGVPFEDIGDIGYCQHCVACGIECEGVDDGHRCCFEHAHTRQRDK